MGLTLDLPQLATLAAAMGWASGLRLYAVVFLTGAVGTLGWVALPAGLQLLAHPLVLGAGFLLFITEFVADKIPAVDSLWDAVHTFIRIPAGAALAAAVVGGMGGDAAAWSVVAALLGGTLAATAHTAKATLRAAANASPEPFSNLALSLAGDAAVPALLWLAWAHPLWFWPVLALAVVLAAWLVLKLFKSLRHLVRRMASRG